MEETVILQQFMHTKGFLVSLPILKTWDKYIVKHSRKKKVFGLLNSLIIEW